MTAGPFVKRVDISKGALGYQIEREKARQMTEIFSSERDLAVPSLLDADAKEGVLVFERMPSLRPLSASTPDVWFERVGRSLALIHANLDLSGELAVTRCADRGREGLVFVHGDFMPNNLGMAGDCLFVFDWGLRPWTTELYTRATPAVDLAGFIGPWIIPSWWDFRLPIAKLQVMLDAYLDRVGSAPARVARETLGAEISHQCHYLAGQVRRRAAWKRPIATWKLFVNGGILRRVFGGRIPRVR